jgi:predicted lipoprotein
MKHTLVFFLLPLVLLFAACEDDSSSNPCESDFDQQALFLNTAENLIIPAYAKLESSSMTLDAAAQTFAEAPSTTSLEVLRAAFRSAYLDWQAVAQYEFGPAEERALRATLNNFPLNEQALESKVAAADYDFTNPNTFDKGFPALDYLLYGLGDGTESTIVSELSTDLYADFLLAQTQFIAEAVSATHDAWTGGYLSTFVDNTGTAAGSSLSLIINNLNEHYEMIKRDKIGVPSGVVTLGFTNPDEVEARYSGLSLDLAEAATEAAQLFYTGGNGAGLDDYLEAVNATKEGESLNTRIQAQFGSALEALAKVNGPLREAVDEETEVVVTAYNELTKQIVNIKTDLPSVLCVAITYIDNPSDSD